MILSLHETKRKETEKKKEGKQEKNNQMNSGWIVMLK